MTNAWTRINTTLLLLVLFALLAVISLLATNARGGPLDPTGPPGPTLPQVEARSPIPPVGWNGTFPIAISQPGSYVFTRSLTATSGGTNGIQITVSNVSIDMSGFTLAGFNETANGIAFTGLQSGIRISNGIVRDWDTGVRGGTVGSLAVFSRVERVTAISNAHTGIALGFDSEVIDCNASQNTSGPGVFVQYGVVRNCHVTDNAYGIEALDQSLIEGNRVFNNTSGIRVGLGTSVGGSVVRSNTAIGNIGYDIFLNSGGDHVLDSNVVTCPANVGGVGTAVVYDQRYQRNPC